jgi:hypothetical protein
MIAGVQQLVRPLHTLQNFKATIDQVLLSKLQETTKQDEVCHNQIYRRSVSALTNTDKLAHGLKMAGLYAGERLHPG